MSGDAPCGPDLEQTDDPEFIEYYFEAEGRLPERYFVPGMRVGREGQEGSDDTLFDPASVDHKTERSTIEGLLKRSRDLRLLTLLARWEILAGRLTGFADAMDATAAVLEAFPDDAHPQIGDTNSDRRGALDTLTTPVTMNLPLHYVSLTGQPGITLRRYLAATGAVTPRAGEEEASAGDILDALKSDSAAAQVSKAQSDLTRAANAFARIKAAGKAHPDKPMSLNFDDVLGVIAQIQDMIRQARPELHTWDETGEDAASQEALLEGENAVETALPVAAVPPPSQVEEIDGQPAARVTLQAVEGFLRRHEPSSAALLLVTQARLLIGKPLIEALETLLPEESRRAAIDFGPATGFVLNMDRLRQLSGETANGAPDEGPDPAQPVLSSRADVGGYIRAVESFFRSHEPTSPVPTLLVRARHYLDKDFDAIVAELIPIPPKAEN